jgi:hypothetical protein
MACATGKERKGAEEYKQSGKTLGHVYPSIHRG